MFRRGISARIEEARQDTKVLLVTGPRQTGKSTLVRQFAGESQPYVTLDDAANLDRARQDPGDFLDSYGGRLILDEVQRAPKLMLAVKLRVDRSDRRGDYILTGSSDVLAVPKVADSLAGRMEIFDLLPLTQAEIAGTPDRNFVDWIWTEPITPATRLAALGDVEARITAGGFPEPVQRSHPRRRREWARSYLRTILERDVRDVAQLEQWQRIPRILQLLAARNGATANVLELSREMGLPPSTLTRYLDVLRRVFLLQEVPGYYRDHGQRLTKSPRVYIVDPLLAAELMDQGIGASGDRLRLLLGGFVANELRRLTTFSDTRPGLFHLRTARQTAVDFVLEGPGGQVIGLQPKAAPSVQAEDFRGLEYLAELEGDAFARGYLLYLGSEIVPFGTRFAAVPLSALWS